MADNQVTLEINVEAKDAQKAIDQFGASAVKSVKSAERSFDSLSGSLKGLGGSVAALLGPLATLATVYKSISEANEAEKATRALAISLASTGEYSKEAVANMQDFAEELSNLTGIDDDVVSSQLAVAKSFGITNDQAKNLVKAASNLSAVTGVDLDTAVKQLGGTYDGTVGKLGNLGAEFRALTKEQNENGAVIDLINKKYEGAGAVLGDTFEGQLNRVQNAFNDAFKAIGTEIINDPNILNGLKVVTDALKAFAPLAASAARGLISLFKVFGTGLGVITSSITSVASSLSSLFGKDDWAKNLDKLTASSYDFIEALNKEETATDSVTESKDRFDKQMTKVSDSYDKNSKNAEKNAKIIAELEKDYLELSKALQTAGFNELQVAAKTAGDRFKIVDDALKKGIINEMQASKDRQAILDDYNVAYEKSIKEQLEMEKKKADEIAALQKQVKEDIQSISEDPTKYYGKEGARAALNDKGSEAAVAAGIGAAKTVTGGKQAAIKLAGTIANAVVPGLGPLIEVFAQGKDAVKGFVKDFFNAIPDIIQGIIEGLPAIIEALVEILSNPAFWKNLVMAIVNGVKYFVTSIIGSIVQVFANLIPGFREVIDGFGAKLSMFANDIGERFKGFINSIGDFFRGFAQSLQNIFKPFIQAIDALKNAFQPLVDVLVSVKEAFEKAGGTFGKGGGKGVIAETAERIGDALGFAKGGIVPLYAARGTDTVPAMLTPGEMVVPRDMVGQLGNFLDGGGKSDAILMAILNAVQQPVTVQSEVKVNQSAFADIILQLNRQNARLAV